MNIPSWARKGAKVVCVDAGGGGTLLAPQDVREGTIYTIGGVCRSLRGNGWSLQLVECPNCFPGERDDGWRIERFRPLVDDANDNEIEARLYHEKRKHHKAPARKVVSA